MDLGLNGRTVLVTGGSSGIGRAIALLYAREPGVNVAITYHSKEAEAAALVGEIEEMGARAVAVHMALGDHDTIQSAVDTVARSFGSVDVLINNAVQWGDPANRGRRFEDVPISYWEEMLRANLIGTVRVTQLVVPFMRAGKWGRIVNISSDVAYDSMIGSGPYGSTKAALEGLTSNLVTELSADGILSNVVVPSWTLTDRALRSFPEEFRAIAAGAFPTGRITEPDDVASLAVYLGSAANGHVNGEVIRATGKGSQATLSMAMREFRARQ